MRRLLSSVYDVEFDADSVLDQRVLLPATVDESNGMEDARFTRFVGTDGAVEYRATYTAYDGQQIAPRLLTSPDLRRFQARRLTGPAVRNKGMALFPRLVGGRHLALCRSDGESTGLTSSADGVAWEADDRAAVTGPRLGDVADRQLRAADRDRRAAGWCSPTASARCAPTPSARCCSTSTTRAG